MELGVNQGKSYCPPYLVSDVQRYASFWFLIDTTHSINISLSNDSRTSTGHITTTSQEESDFELPVPQYDDITIIVFRSCV
jgi:hypothetical protein